jgi:hypothetical protein
MQQWEYAVILAGTRTVSVQTPAKHYNAEPGRMAELLNKLGDSGWELTTTSTSSADDEFMLILKRPRQQVSDVYTGNTR